MKLIRFFALLVLLCMATSVFAQHAAKGKAKNDDAAANQQATADNPQLRQPTADEMRELTAGIEKLVSQPTQGLRQFQVGDWRATDLGDTHQNVALAKMGPDGKLMLGCVTTRDEAIAFLKAVRAPSVASAATTEWEEK